MTHINAFASWDEDVHTSPDQIKRLSSASKSATTPSHVDKEQQTATFAGSGVTPYVTTLSSCTCIDFSRRKLPCKHIYRLAMELGLIEADFKSGVNKNTLKSQQISLKDAVAQIELLTEQEQLILKNLLHWNIYSNPESSISVDLSENPNFRTCALVKCQQIPLSILLEKEKKADIVAIVKSINNNFELPKGMLKKDLIDWCCENMSQIIDMLPTMYSLTLVPEFKDARLKTHTYLARKFDWDDYLDENMKTVKYPCGAKFGELSISIKMSPSGTHSSDATGNPYICRFPEDEVTELLTLYGHNRCLNGYLAVPED